MSEDTKPGVAQAGDATVSGSLVASNGGAAHVVTQVSGIDPTLAALRQIEAELPNFDNLPPEFVGWLVIKLHEAAAHL